MRRMRSEEGGRFSLMNVLRSGRKQHSEFHRRRHACQVEQLESGQLLAAVVWSGQGDGTS